MKREEEKKRENLITNGTKLEENRGRKRKRNRKYFSCHLQFVICLLDICCVLGLKNTLLNTR